MSNDRKNEQPSILTAVAAAATAGALIVGAIGAISSFMSEQEREESAVVATGPRRQCSVRRGDGDLDNWALLSGERAREVGDEIPEGLLCKICADRQITHVLECGHTLCRECASGIVRSTKLCPFDRRSITKIPQKIYL